MTDADRARTNQEIDFPTARAQLEAEIHAILGGGGVAVAPDIQFEKGETRFRFPVARIEAAEIVSAMLAIKQHIENVRIHTMEPGYTIFQDAGKSQEQKSTLEGMRFKFITIGSPRVEISRRGNWTQDELQAVIKIFRVFHAMVAANDPGARLAALGVPVYQADRTKTGDKESKPKKTTRDQVVLLNRRHRLAGYKETKQEVLESIILPLKRPEVFQEVARLTRGDVDNLPSAVLFEGPPGVGKTTMARIIASETGIPLVYVSVENIVSKYYGESAQNMAQIFEAAAGYERAILFLDEIDALAGNRDTGLFEATRRVLSVLLRKIDGFDSRSGILTIGATNRAQDLDRALVSRFDSVITFPLPGARERAAIFKSYAKHLSIDDLHALAKSSKGMSGRTIEDICEFAERRWARELIGSGASISPPPRHLYLEITASRADSVAG